MRPPPAPTSTPKVDGRDARWAQHRLSRRRDLVEAALRAIRHHGAGVGMEEIAAEAGTSKTVIYRHLGDRNGVYLAVVEAVDALILSDLQAAMAASARQESGAAAQAGSDGADVTRLVASMVDSYLRLVERDPEIYRFVVTRPLLDRAVQSDPVAGLTGRIGDQLADIFAAHLQAHTREPGPAQTWGHGIVGFVRAAADHWLSEPGTLTRADVVDHVTTLVGPGLQAAMRDRDDASAQPADGPAHPADSPAQPAGPAPHHKPEHRSEEIR